MFFKNMVTVCFMLNLILILSRDNQDIGEQHHNTKDEINCFLGILKTFI